MNNVHTVTAVTSVLIPDAVMKWKDGLGEKEIESLIGETLKHAPAHINKSVEV